MNRAFVLGMNSCYSKFVRLINAIQTKITDGLVRRVESLLIEREQETLKIKI